MLGAPGCQARPCHARIARPDRPATAGRRRHAARLAGWHADARQNPPGAPTCAVRPRCEATVFPPRSRGAATGTPPAMGCTCREAAAQEDKMLSSISGQNDPWAQLAALRAAQSTSQASQSSGSATTQATLFSAGSSANGTSGNAITGGLSPRCRAACCRSCCRSAACRAMPRAAPRPARDRPASASRAGRQQSRQPLCPTEKPAPAA